MMDKKAMFKLTYGLFVLSAKEGDKDNGCIINTAMQVASKPERISIAVSKANYTHDMVLHTGAFNVSVLSQEVDFELFKRFGFQSGRDVDKFEGFTGFARSENGIIYIKDGTNAYLSGKVEQTVDLGSHTLFLASMPDMAVLGNVPSVTYEYYQEHIKPKKPEGTGGKKTVWRCRVCGYEYEGEELPADYICPLCKHPASDFEKVTVG